MRAAKTIADERAVVQKESAAIRASFREESHDSNVRCVDLSQREGHMFTTKQEKQCRQASVPLHFGREDTFWTDRMSEAAGVAAFCRQAVGLPRHHVAAGREPRSPDTGYKLSQKVWRFSMPNNCRS